MLAYGGKEALAGLGVRLGARLVGQGPKASVALVARDVDTLAVGRALARDVALLAQRGCLSVHAVFAEGDARELAEALAFGLAFEHRRLPPGPPDPGALARVQQWRGAAELGDALIGRLGRLEGTVVLTLDARFQPSPGLRAVRVHALSVVGDALAAIAPWRGRLQGAALAGAGALELSSALEALGVRTPSESCLRWGSTNATLHIPAIAREAGIEMSLDVFDALSRHTPLIGKFRPASPYTVVDLDEAGGIPAVLKILQPLLYDDLPTVTGEMIRDRADRSQSNRPGVLHPLEAPLSPEGGLAIVHGNLAPGGAVVKQSGVMPDMLRHTGPARVYECEEDLENSIAAKDIQPGDVLVIRNEGPRGGPGMRELSIPAAMLTGMGLNETVAMITDGESQARREARASWPLSESRTMHN